MVKVQKILQHKLIGEIGKILRLSLQVILFALLPFILFTFITSKTELIKGFSSFVVLTGSMEPSLPVGSLIYTKSAVGYDIGDIITYKTANDQTVTHRIVDLTYTDATNYMTKGDANNSYDTTPVASDKVLGKVYFSVPYIGYFMNFLRTPNGFILFIIVPVGLFVLLELLTIKKEIEKEIEKKMLKKFQDKTMTVSS